LLEVKSDGEGNISSGENLFAFLPGTPLVEKQATARIGADTCGGLGLCDIE
jgi:hypothetical protein